MFGRIRGLLRRTDTIRCIEEAKPAWNGRQRALEFAAGEMWKDELEYRKDPKSAHDVHLKEELFKELNALGYEFYWIIQFNPAKLSEKDKAIIPIILKYADKFENEGTKLHCMTCLGVKGFYDATEYLLNEYEKNMLPGGDDLLLSVAANALGKIQDPRHIDRYLSYISGEKIYSMAWPMVEVLGKMKVKEAILRLIELLDGENKIKESYYGTILEGRKYCVSQEAIGALSQFKDPQYIKYIEKFLEPEKIPWINYPDTKEGRASLRSTRTEYRNIAKKAIKRMGGALL